MLLASGVSGRGPGAFSSDMTLAKLIPGVAAYRDSFYSHLIEHMGGKRGTHLREEATFEAALRRGSFFSESVCRGARRIKSNGIASRFSLLEWGMPRPAGSRQNK